MSPHVHWTTLDTPLNERRVNWVEHSFPVGSTRHTPSLWDTTSIGSLHSIGSLETIIIDKSDAQNSTIHDQVHCTCTMSCVHAHTHAHHRVSTLYKQEWTRLYDNKSIHVIIMLILWHMHGAYARTHVHTYTHTHTQSYTNINTWGTLPWLGRHKALWLCVLLSPPPAAGPSWQS